MGEVEDGDAGESGGFNGSGFVTLGTGDATRSAADKRDDGDAWNPDEANVDDSVEDLEDGIAVFAKDSDDDGGDKLPGWPCFAIGLTPQAGPDIARYI